MTTLVNRCTNAPVRFVVGLSLLLRALHDPYFHLEGRRLEALSRLFAQKRANLRVSHDCDGLARSDQRLFAYWFGVEQNQRLGLGHTTACRTPSRPPPRIPFGRQFPGPIPIATSA